MPTGVFWSFVLSCATDTMRWSSSMPKTVCATARTSRTVCFAGLLGSARTWTSTGRPDRSPTTRTAWTPLRRQSSSSRSRSSSAGFRSPSDDNSSFDHSLDMATPSTPRGPGAPARTQHTAIRPRSVGAPRCRCYLWGLRGDQIRVKLCVPFVQRRRTRSVSGWRRQGLGLISNELPEAKRDVRRAHSVAQAGELMFQGVSCKRPWFALRPARQHWSQCCSPVALPVGSNTEAFKQVAGALPSPS